MPKKPPWASQIVQLDAMNEALKLRHRVAEESELDVTSEDMRGDFCVPITRTNPPSHWRVESRRPHQEFL